jgi:hypothetical protein
VDTFKHGQQAVEAKEIYTDLFVTNAKKFMDNFDLGSGYYELKPSMVPQFNVQIHVDKRNEFEEKLATFRINGQIIQSRLKAEVSIVLILVFRIWRRARSRSS